MTASGSTITRTVLLAEDSPTQARRTQIDLGREGFHVIAAENGRVALDLAEKELPDLILSDVLMPEVDGFRLCLEARMNRRLRPIPIILRSAQFIADEDRGLARAAGADAYIQKDLTPAELAAVIRETLEAAGDERVFFDPETFRSEYGARLLSRLVQEAADLEGVNERLVENQARLQGVLDNAPTNISVKGLDGRYVIANPQFEQLVRRPPEAIIGKTDHDLFPPEAAQLLQEKDQAVVNSGLPLEFEERLLVDGEPRHFSTIKFPLCDPESKVQGLCTISTDVTERRRLERELREFQKMETVGLLAGGVAHDFGNYLSAITMYVSFLEEGMTAEDPHKEDLIQIKRAADSATRLARQLMTLSRQESIAAEPIDLNETITDIERLLKIAVGNKVEMQTELTPAVPPININPGHLEQVLMNFAVNAHDAMPSGGRFTVATSSASMSNGAGDGGSPIQAVVLRVSDTGHGMDPETQEKIFDPFFTTKSRKKGTGLGLATVKKVIDVAGGTISVRSAPNEGTTFEITLPAATDAPPVELSTNQPVRDETA